MKNTRNKRSINTEGNGFVLSPAAQRTTGTLLLYFRDSHFFPLEDGWIQKQSHSLNQE
jgi:hypothetical protein